MDALSDVLKVAHLTGGVFLHAEFFAPWCIATRLAPGQGKAMARVDAMGQARDGGLRVLDRLRLVEDRSVEFMRKQHLVGASSG